MHTRWCPEAHSPIQTILSPKPEAQRLFGAGTNVVTGYAGGCNVAIYVTASPLFVTKGAQDQSLGVFLVTLRYQGGKDVSFALAAGTHRIMPADTVADVLITSDTGGAIWPEDLTANRCTCDGARQ